MSVSHSPGAGTDLFLVCVRTHGRGQQPDWNQPGQKVGFLGSWLQIVQWAGVYWFQVQLDPGKISRSIYFSSSLSLPQLPSLHLSFPLS